MRLFPLKPWFLALLLSAALQAPARAAEPAPGADARNIYIVAMREPPAIAAAAGASSGRVRVSRKHHFDAHSESVRRYAANLVASHDEALAAAGAPDEKVYSYKLAFNGFAARLTAAEAAKLARQPGVASVRRDSIRHLNSNASATFMGLMDTTSGLRGALGLKGENVVIGVIDSGITPDHPSFSDKSQKKKPRMCRTEWGSTSLLGMWLCARFKSPRFSPTFDPPTDWNGACVGGENFACNNKLIGARFYRAGFDAAHPDGPDANEFNSARDADGHGTHLASIAAGVSVKASLGGTEVASISGIAPRARIAVYKACWLEPGATRGSCAMSDLQSAIEDAIADGVDIINYAVGDAEGGPTDLDAQALLEASDAGILAVVAAGNRGPAPGTVESPGSAPWVLTVAASSRAGQRFDEIVRATEPATAVGDFTATEAAFTRPLRSAGPLEALLALADDGSGDASDACEELADASGKILLIRRGTCNFQVKLANAEDAGAIGAIVVNSEDTARYTMGGERGSVGIPALLVSRADGEFLAARLAAGDAVKVKLEKGLIATRNDAGNVVYANSARGPNPVTTDILKPDVTAPGVEILGAQTPNVANGVRGERYQYLSGTSMAVPQVVGVAALLREAHPDWSPAAIRSALVTTARQDLHKEDGVADADPFDFGGGHVVPNRAIAPGLVYDAGREDYDAFACGAGIARVSVDDCAALAESGFPTSIDELNLPSIATSAVVRERTVRRRVTNVGPAATWQASVTAPAGVTMSVSPASLSLAPGETAEFAVTFTNLGEPDRLEQWGFGSLNWATGTQAVRSPVAVRTAPLAMPAVVTGSGSSGTAQYEVEFGYGGSFAAIGAGLAAPQTGAGNVLDDPLGIYSITPEDATPPDHIRRFHVTVAPGTAFLRVALEGTDEGSSDDLDLYLLCPGQACSDGRQGYASNRAGADEVLDIIAPDPGVYTIDVHGYQTDDDTGGPGANFALRTWTIDDTATAGALSISAPSAATAGSTGTIDVGWQGLEAGSVYLGIVTHADAERVLGRTLLEVVAD